MSSALWTSSSHATAARRPRIYFTDNLLKDLPRENTITFLVQLVQETYRPATLLPVMEWDFPEDFSEDHVLELIHHLKLVEAPGILGQERLVLRPGRVPSPTDVDQTQTASPSSRTRWLS